MVCGVWCVVCGVQCVEHVRACQTDIISFLIMRTHDLRTIRPTSLRRGAGNLFALRAADGHLLWHLAFTKEIKGVCMFAVTHPLRHPTELPQIQKKMNV